MNESFEELALRVWKEMAWLVTPDPVQSRAFALRIRDELCKGQEPVERLVAMTAERDGLLTALDQNWITHQQLTASQAYSQKLRNLMIRMRDKGDGEYWSQMNEALTLPNDDTALKQYGANLLRDAADKCSDVTETVLWRDDLRRMADELEAGK